MANVIAKATGFTSLDSEPMPDIDRFINSRVMEFIVKAGYNMDEKTLRDIVRQIMEIIYADGRDMLTLFEDWVSFWNKACTSALYNLKLRIL